MDDGAARSHELLSQRVASIPNAIREALTDDAPHLARAAFPKPEATLHVVGAGGSAGPARILAACLSEAGWMTKCLPPSCFALQPPAGPLCVVSQGMSPNAQLVLRRAQKAAPKPKASTLLITASDADQGVVLRHGPATEPGMLVRVVGPVLSSLAAIRFSGIVPESELRQLPERVAAQRCAPPEARFDHIVLVTAGPYQEIAHGLRWKLLETLGYGDPPVYDVLQFAHGPFQQIFDRRALIIALDRGTPAEQPLFTRLAEMAVAERHQVLRLRATLPSPLCWFEHDAQLNHLVLGLLLREPRDLITWPGKGRDDVLYGLDQ